MKIHICYVIVNCKRTGPMRQTLNIIKNLNFDEFEVSLITLFPEIPGNSMLNDFLQFTTKHTCLNLNWKTSFLFGKSKLKKVLEKWKPQIIQGLGMPPYRLSLGYKKATHLLTIRNYAYEDYPTHYGNKIFGTLLAFLDIRLIKKLHAKGYTFVTCSKSLSKIYQEKENLNLPFIRNGVENSLFKKKDNQETLLLRKKLNLPIEKTIFISTGALCDRKDQEAAIEGVLKSQYSSQMVLLLCGHGDNFENLRNKYSKKSNIIFTGQVSNVDEYLRASDVYISTSKSEGLPNSVLEAMSTALPVLLSAIPQHLEFFEINNKIGFYYSLGNSDELIKALDKMFLSNREEMGNESFKAIMQSLSAQIMSANYQKLYKQMLGET